MSKKSKRKKQRVVNSHAPTHIVFTFPAVKMLRDALRLVEESVLQNTKPLPNIELAAETLGGLHIKLDDMLQREEWDREIPLYYNEIHILYAAIHIYLVHLSINKGSSLITPCLVLCKQFSRLVEQMDGKALAESTFPDTVGE